MKAMLRILCLAALIGALFPASAAFAQLNSPEAVAEAYYDAVRSSNWAEVARLTHADTQEQIQNAVLAAPPADSAGSAWPSLSREQILTALGVPTLAEMQELGPQALLERLFSRGIPGSVRSVLVGVENDTDSEILGHVAEGDSLAHVLRRARFAGQLPELSAGRAAEFELGDRIDVLTLRLDGGEWRVVEDSPFRLLMMIRMLLGSG
jgi:hypothetical protein